MRNPNVYTLPPQLPLASQQAVSNLQQQIQHTQKDALACQDFESKKFNTVEYFNRIDYVYIVDEDGELIVTTKDGEKTYTVHSGDIVLRMYSLSKNYRDKEFIVIHSGELNDYICRYKAFLEENSKEVECKDCDCAEINCTKC